MLDILGISISLPDSFSYLAEPGFTFMLNFLSWILIAFLINFIFIGVVRWITRQSFMAQMNKLWQI